jgi:hypothetical protein
LRLPLRTAFRQAPQRREEAFRSKRWRIVTEQGLTDDFDGRDTLPEEIVVKPLQGKRRSLLSLNIRAQL